MNSSIVYHGNRLCQYEACCKSRDLNLHEEVKKGSDGKGRVFSGDVRLVPFQEA